MSMNLSTPHDRRAGGWLWVRALGAVLAAAVLASCGGSEAPGATTPAPALPKLVVALTNASGAAQNSLNAATPLTATATLTDAGGRPIANSLVQFALTFAGSSSATLSPASGSGVTDANGRFAVSLLAASPSAEGGGTITATALNVTDTPTASASFQVVATALPPRAPSLTLALTDSLTGASRNTLTRTSPLNATAVLLDGNGKPVANSLIQLSLTFAGSSAVAVLSPSSGSGITDANGRFQASLIAANATAEGSGTIKATAVNQTDAPPVTVSFQVVPTAPPAVAPAVSLALTDPATGASRNTLTLASPLNATATLTDAAGKPVANSLVQFSLSSGGSSPVAVLSPASGNGITDANGKFAVTLIAAGLTAQGAGTVTATAVNEKDAPATSAAFQVGATSISLGNVTRNPASINPLQTSTIGVTVTGVPTSVPVSVRFTSSCTSSGLASLPESVVTVNGLATAVYTDKGCSGQDTITISADGAASVQTTITILPAPPTAIQFVSATPDVISVSGSGGQTSSLVIFKVVNAAQQAVANLPVTLSLSTSVGGVTLDGQTGPLTKQTAADGTVSATVVAGSQPGPVRVVASTASGLNAVSSLLTIQTGLPTQNRFSLSVQTFNIEGWNVDGTTTSLTIRAADRVGNPVPNGTTINFRSSGALIEPSCRTTAGACSVNFRSQANRPASGRVAVLAWAVGEETFQDTNGNNRYDSGEPFGDLGDAFVDANFDGIYQTSEEFIAFNPLATSVCASSPLGAPGRPNSCDGIWGLAHVRDSAPIVLSASNAVADLPSSIRLSPFSASTCVGTLSFPLPDINGNPMPAGTTVTAEVSPSFPADKVTIVGSPVPNTLSVSGIAIDLSIAATASPDPNAPQGCRGDASRLLRITVKSPLGGTTILPAVTVVY
jgi:hypothetical protein